MVILITIVTTLPIETPYQLSIEDISAFRVLIFNIGEIQFYQILLQKQIFLLIQQHPSGLIANSISFLHWLHISMFKVMSDGALYIHRITNWYYSHCLENQQWCTLIANPVKNMKYTKSPDTYKLQLVSERYAEI